MQKGFYKNHTDRERDRERKNIKKDDDELYAWFFSLSEQPDLAGKYAGGQSFLSATSPKIVHTRDKEEEEEMTNASRLEEEGIFDSFFSAKIFC